MHEGKWNDIVSAFKIEEFWVTESSGMRTKKWLNLPTLGVPPPWEANKSQTREEGVWIKRMREFERGRGSNTESVSKAKLPRLECVVTGGWKHSPRSPTLAACVPALLRHHREQNCLCQASGSLLFSRLPHSVIARLQRHKAGCFSIQPPSFCQWTDALNTAPLNTKQANTHLWIQKNSNCKERCTRCFYILCRRWETRARQAHFLGEMPPLMFLPQYVPCRAKVALFGPGHVAGVMSFLVSIFLIDLANM